MDWVTGRATTRVAMSVDQNHAQPRLEVRPGVEAIGKAEGFDVRVLHEILRVGDIASDGTCGAIEGVAE